VPHDIRGAVSGSRLSFVGRFKASRVWPDAFCFIQTLYFIEHGALEVQAGENHVVKAFEETVARFKEMQRELRKAKAKQKRGS